MARAMKDSGIEWIGKIPNNWSITPFRAYVKERTERNKYKKTTELLSLSFALGVTLFKDKIYNKDRIKENFEEYNIVYENDLVLSPNDIIKGSIFVSKYYGCISPMYFVFSPRCENTHNLYYLSYLLRTREAGRRFFFIARGLIGAILDNGKYVTRRMSVSRNDLLSFKVLLPSYREQTNIVSFLDSKCQEIDNVLAKTRSSIEEYKKLKQAIITKAVTKGIRKNRKMKDSGIEWIGEIPEDWIIEKIKYLGEYRNGLIYSPEDIVSEKEGTLVLRSSNIQDGKLVFEDNVYVTTNISPKLMVKQGDILICSRNGSRALIGKNAIINKDMNASFGAFMMIFRSKYYKYLYYVLNSEVFSYYLGTFLTATINQLTGSNLGNMNIVFCNDESEQNEIVTYLDIKCSEINTLITKKEQLISELESYKKSLIYEYVTGKKEVPMA